MAAMRCLVAARLSRLADGSTGLEKQDDAPRKYAELQEWDIVATAADSDVSGDSDPWSRPELGPWLTEPEKIAAYDVILATHVDRLARSTVHFMKLLHWADEHGKRIITTGEAGVDFSSAVGKLFGYMIAWLGEQELAAIKRRYASTQAWLREHGYLSGKAPWGWLIVPHPGNADRKTLALDPVLKETAAQVVDRGLRGDTYASIARWLDGQGVPPPEGTVWWGRIIKEWLRNPVLYGRRMTASGHAVLEVEPLIDYPTWKRLQTVVGHNRAPGGYGKDPGVLAGVVFCQRCGLRMTRSSPEARRKRYRYMVCRGRMNQPSRCRNRIREDYLLEWLEREFIGHFGDREVVERIKIPGSGHAAEIELTEHDLRTLDFDDPRFMEKQAALLAERDRLRALPPEPDRVEDRPTGVTVAEHWKSLDEPGRRDYLKRAGVAIRAVREQDGEIFLDLEAEHPEVLSVV